MFFVGSKKRFTSNTLLLHLLPAGAVLFTLLGLTLLGWHNANRSLKNEREAATANFATHTRNSIVERLKTYEVVLQGTAGMFVASDNVTRDEWKKYVGSFDLQKKYPGIQGVGYLAFIPAEQIAPITDSVRAEGYPEFQIFPSGQRDLYSAALYFEPMHGPSGLGFDMYTDPTRREAMVWAQASGEATITRKLTFVVGDPEAGKSGSTMYLPVYNDASQYALPAASRNVKGFVFAPFTGESLFQSILEANAKDKYGVRVYNGPTDQNNLMYESAQYAAYDNDEAYRFAMPMDLYGRQWTLDFRFSPTIIPESTRSGPVTTLVSGTILSFLLASFVLALLVARTRALANAKYSEVQSAKDELLSLASHQLRTPATAVKQYVGMLREGYAGDVTERQRALLEKAWHSNERQLHIINELLYVAKVDANGIVLTLRKLEVGTLIRDTIQELSDTDQERKNKIRLQLPKRKIYVEADEHCLRMAIENLLGNALKYSYELSPVNVKVTSRKDEIRIAIKDRGVGIAPDEIPLLFQRFSRIPNKLSRQISGSGIGLYLSEQFIRLHGGHIEVESVKGKGSTFTIYIPKKQSAVINRV